MFEKERIAQLHSQGYCTAAISVHLDLPSGYVREVVTQVAARQAVRRARWESSPEGRKAVAAAKRDHALQLLAEADSVLDTHLQAGS